MDRITGPDYPSWQDRDPERRRFSSAVAAGCLAGLIVFVVTAVVCAIINHFGGGQ